MNFNHAFQGPSPTISTAADDFVEIGQLRRHVDQLASRCCVLENGLRAEKQARKASESQVLHLQQAYRAREADIVELRSQLHQERLRADTMSNAGRRVLNPASIPLRIVPVGDSRMDLGREFGGSNPVNPSNPSELLPGPAPTRNQYPPEIPERDRETIRTRMLKDRGPNTPAPAASPQAARRTPAAPAPGAYVSGPCVHDEIITEEAGTSQLGHEGWTGVADVDGEETEDDFADTEITKEVGTSQLGHEGGTGAADVDSEETEDDFADMETDSDDDCCANDTTTSASGITLGKHLPCNEDDGNQLASLAASHTAAEDGVTNHGPAPVQTESGADPCTTLGSSARIASAIPTEPVSSSSAVDGHPAENPAEIPSPTGGVVTAPSIVITTTSVEPVSSSSAVNGHRAENHAGIPSPPERVVTAPSIVKTEATSCERVSSSSAVNGNRAENPVGRSPAGRVVTSPSIVKTEATAAYLEPAVATKGSTSTAPISFTHQLFLPSLTQADCNTRSVSDSTDTVGPPSSIDNCEARDVDRREEGADASDFKQEPVRKDRFSHNTFCSSCKSFRTEQEALAKCAACPRVLCRTCSGREGEKVPRGLNADDIVFSADKCLCQERDSEFSRPLGGKDPQAHLLEELKKHDLAFMFVEPVNVDENPGYLSYVTRDDMIDLSTMTTKMEQRKQYQSSRGKLMFRRDLKRMWENCWTFAGHTPESSKEHAAGIVKCTFILEAMVQNFYAAYMEETELVTDTGSWLAEQERRHNQNFVMCVNQSFPWPGGGKYEDFEPPFAAAECEDDSDDVDLDEENKRIGATVRHKRKFVLNDDNDDDDDDRPSSLADVSAGRAGLDSNICALAAIGQRLKYASGET